MTAELKAQIDVAVAKARLDDAFGTLCAPELRTPENIFRCLEWIDQMDGLLVELRTDMELLVSAVEE